MKEKCIITKITDKEIFLETLPGEQCSKCCSCNAGSPRHIVVTKDKAGNVAEGDKVEINVHTKSMMKIYIMLYALPLAVFVGSILVLSMFLPSPIWNFLHSLLLTLVAYLFIGIYIRRHTYFLGDIKVKKI